MALPNRPVIMVVDDDLLICTLIQDVLDDMPYKVMLAQDGATALITMTTVLPDVVTLDLEMPGFTGIQVLELIRQNEQLREVKVVVITGVDDIPARVTELAQAIIRKPFDIDHLVRIIQQLAPRPALEDS